MLSFLAHFYHKLSCTEKVDHISKCYPDFSDVSLYIEMENTKFCSEREMYTEPRYIQMFFINQLAISGVIL